MAKRSKKKTYAELLKISEEAVARKNAEYSFDPKSFRPELKERIEAAIEAENAKVDSDMVEQHLDHARNREISLNFASRALIAGLGAFVNSLGVTVTRGAESADITVEHEPTEWVDLTEIHNLLSKNRGDETCEAYLKRLIDEDNARKNPPKAEEVKPAIRQLDLED